MIATVALLFVPVANDANWVSFGGAGAFAPHKTVHMLGEDINITLYDDKIHVRAYFSFENRGPATTVKMAFPFETTGYSDMSQPLLRFATKVDGQPVAVERVQIAPFTQSGREFSEQGIRLAAPFAMVKEVPFEDGHRRTVLVDYVVVRAGVGSGGTADEYTLQSGATWAGRIGQCTVTVDWSGVRSQGKPDLRFVRDNGTVFDATWNFTGPRTATTTLVNIEPDFDLSLSSIENFWHVTLNGRILAIWHGAAVHDPSFGGDPSDPTVLTRGLYDFFSEDYSDDRAFITGPAGNAFGNWLAVISKSEFRDGTGKVRRLRRPVINFGSSDEAVFLRDLVEALGGTFKWVAEWERIYITLPTRDIHLRNRG